MPIDYISPIYYNQLRKVEKTREKESIEEEIIKNKLKSKERKKKHEKLQRTSHIINKRLHQS